MVDLDRDFQKGWGVETMRYYSSPFHTLIGSEGERGRITLDNIGENGKNLSFAVLSMNRASGTIRLMKSIAALMPGFAGEFVIGDNGSSPDQLRMLYEACAQMPYACRIEEFGKNYGVAGGRNKLFARVKTPWILSLDNDVYFVGDPLKKIQKDIARLGCHFLTMPLVNEGQSASFLYGGHLYLDNFHGGVNAGGGSALISPNVEMNVEHEPFLSTFVSGGVVVFSRDTFFSLGGYEDRMFVGFEDTEFSVRVFQKGYKVGTCGMCCIVHDHPKPVRRDDAKYEKERFSVDYLKQSAKVFEDKHGFRVWNLATEKWLDGRRESLLAGTGEESGVHAAADKPKIALVIDKPDWALDHIAAQLIKNLGYAYDFRKIYLSVLDNLAKLLLLADDCQIIHFLWRPLASDFGSSYTQSEIYSLGMTPEEFAARYIKGKAISVAVYDHLMLDGPESEFTPKLFTDPDTIVTSYTVSSNKLKQLYDSRADIRLKPSAVTPDGVDLSLFYPKSLWRLEDISSRTLRVGWVGNSKWAVNDLKGLDGVIRPAIETLQKEGRAIEFVTSDRNEKMIPHEKMPDFYNSIDVYVCASLHEGTPNPVLEAMACGLPVVSTDVGLVPELFGPLQRQFILEERSAACLAEKLRLLLDEPQRLARLSQENLEQIKAWDWTRMTENFKAYFDACLRRI